MAPHDCCTLSALLWHAALFKDLNYWILLLSTLNITLTKPYTKLFLHGSHYLALMVLLLLAGADNRVQSCPHPQIIGELQQPGDDLPITILCVRGEGEEKK